MVTGVGYEMLGPLRVRRGGVDVDLGPPTQRALLAALLLDVGRSVTTAELVRRVWGTDDTEAHVTALQVALSRLRKRLSASTGEQPVHTVPGGYRIELDRAEVDTTAFEDLVAMARAALAADDVRAARERTAEALALWRGEPFADLGEGFLPEVVAGLVEQRAAAVELAAELDLLLGQHAELTRWLPREIIRHPLREGLRTDLMVALYRVGRQAEALELYEATRRFLADELGIDPGPDLRRVHELVLRQDPALSPPAVPKPAAGVGIPQASPRVPASAPVGLMGRDAELARARELLGDGTAPARLLVLTGEAGVGKTRLAEVLTADGGRLTARGTLLDQDGVPAFWPWAQVLDELAHHVPDVVAGALAGAGAPAGVLLEGGIAVPGTHRGDLFRAVGALLDAVAADRPITLVLEDLQWADPETVDLTEYLLTDLDRSAVRFIWTLRTPTGHAATTRLLASAARHPRARVEALTGLDADAVQQLSAAHLGSPVGREAAHRLRARTEGNPFFVVELTRLLAQERTAHGRAGVPVPDGVSAVVEQRLRHLGPETQALLTAAAVHGRVLDLDVLAEVCRSTPLDLVDPLDAATTAGVLEPSAPGGRLQFTHALVQETLVQACSPMRRRALHAEVAASLTRRHGADGGRLAGIIAGHLVAAGTLGDPRRAAELGIAAATAARGRSALSEAARHLRQVLELLALQPGVLTAQEELDVRDQLGAVMTTTMSYDADEVAAHRRLLDQVAPDRQPLATAVAGLWGAWGLAMAGGPPEDAEALSADLLAQAARHQDPLLELAVRDVLGQARFYAGRMDDARREFLRAVELADELGPTVDLSAFVHHPGATGRVLLAHVAFWQGQDDAADGWAAEAQTLADQVGDTLTAGYVALADGTRHSLAGRPEEARARGRQALAATSAAAADELTASAHVTLGWAAALLDEDTGAGLAELDGAVAAYESGSRGYRGMQHLLRSTALLHHGRSTGAHQAADRGLELARAAGEVFPVPALLAARAQAGLASGSGTPEQDLREARDLAARLGIHRVVDDTTRLIAGDSTPTATDKPLDSTRDQDGRHAS